VNELAKIFRGLKSCGAKMTSSSQLIDYFIHDILDYTQLSNDKGQLIQNLTVFNVKECINNII